MFGHWWQVGGAVLVGILAVAGVLGILFKDTIYRLVLALSLFSGADQSNRFNRIADIYPTSTVPASRRPRPFSEGVAIGLPRKFRFENGYSQADEFLNSTDTSALLVLKDGELCFEQYALTGGPGVNWLSWSMAKSCVSALVGIAIEEGFIQSIEEPITKYVPQLDGSAYGGVRIKDVLQMSSGASWNEDYSDPKSDINRFARVFAFGRSFTKFAVSLKPAREPGKYKLYNSVDTQVLGLLVAEATGCTLTEYMQVKLWEPIGAESPAHWILDSDGVEMAFGGLNATARDYAKLGELYRNHGQWHGRQVVPSDWVNASLTPDAPHLAVNAETLPDAPRGYGQDLGYGFQWWLLDGDEGEFAAMGIYNQFIYVNPSRNITIVKLSANRQYGVGQTEAYSREKESIALFRAIAQTAGKVRQDDAQDAEIPMTLPARQGTWG